MMSLFVDGVCIESLFCVSKLTLKPKLTFAKPIAPQTGMRIMMP